MAAAIAMINLVVLADSWIPCADRTLVLFSLALVLAALYTLGSVATLFATERENETYDILRASPIGPWTVFFGKTLYALSARRPCLASPGRSPAFWPANCRTSGRKTHIIHRLCSDCIRVFRVWHLLFPLVQADHCGGQSCRDGCVARLYVVCQLQPRLYEHGPRSC